MRLSLVLMFVLGLVATSSGQEKQIVSVRTDAAPAIDGIRDEGWKKSVPVTFELAKKAYNPANYKGLEKTSVTISSIYDKENVYFLVQWKDSTESLEQQPWVKQGDGTWKQKAELDEFGRENVYAEDKFAILWSNNTPNFEIQGCAVVCHKARGGKVGGIPDQSPGRKYTNKAGSQVDMWEWRAVRTNPVGQVDDGYIDDTHDPKQNPTWGRHNDDGTGGFVENVNPEKTGPAFMSQAPEGKYWVRDDQKIPFVDSFKPGDMVGSVLVAPFGGSRGDIAAAARWENGVWTLEMKRKLVAGGENAKLQDVQFDDLKKAYFFGISVFDHSESAHMYYDEAIKLTFK